MAVFRSVLSSALVVLIFSGGMLLAQLEYDGSKCLPNQNCGGGNCMTADRQDLSCVNTSYRCTLLANGTLNPISVKVCTDYDSPPLVSCNPQGTTSPCTDMKRWDCGCMQLNASPPYYTCNYNGTGCVCSGDHDDTVVNPGLSTCT